MKSLPDAIYRCRAEQARAAEHLRRNGEDFGAMLWCQDWLKEETLLLLERRHESKSEHMPRFQVQIRLSVEGYVELDAPDAKTARKTVEEFEAGVGVNFSFPIEIDATGIDAYADIEIDGVEEVEEDDKEETVAQEGAK